MAQSARTAVAVRERGAKIEPQGSPASADDDVWALLEETGFSNQVAFMLRIAQLSLQEYAMSGPDLGLTHSQTLVLRLIHARPALTQQRIADALRIKKTNLTPLIDELVSGGLAVRKSSDQHPRANALYLTPKGEQAVKKAKAIIVKHMSVYNDILDLSEKEQLVRLLRKIAMNTPRMRAKAKA